MRIVLVANYLPDRQPSMQRFAALLEAGLSGEGIEVMTMRPEPVFGGKMSRTVEAEKWLGYLDKFCIFPGVLRRKLDANARNGVKSVFHICDHSNAPYVRWLNDVPHVVTCHDLFAVRSAIGEVPQNPTRWSGRQLQNWILKGLRGAGMIACDSEATHRDVVRFAGEHHKRVVTIPLALEPEKWSPESGERDRNWRAIIDAESFGACGDSAVKGFVLHVGAGAWYKNRGGVVRIFNLVKSAAKKGLALVLVGPPLAPAIIEFINAFPGLAARVRCIDGISDTDLAVLYRSAEALLFPSLDEGFGWPVLEANACGCRVVVSRRGSLPEVGGSAAWYIDPDDEDAAARVLEDVLLQTPDQKELGRSAALVNAARFSMQETAQRYIQVYGEVLRSRSFESVKTLLTSRPRRDYRVGRQSG